MLFIMYTLSNPPFSAIHLFFFVVENRSCNIAGKTVIFSTIKLVKTETLMPYGRKKLMLFKEQPTSIYLLYFQKQFGKKMYDLTKKDSLTPNISNIAGTLMRFRDK